MEQQAIAPTCPLFSPLATLFGNLLLPPLATSPSHLWLCEGTASRTMAFVTRCVCRHSSQTLSSASVIWRQRWHAASLSSACSHTTLLALNAVAWRHPSEKCFHKSAFVKAAFFGLSFQRDCATTTTCNLVPLPTCVLDRPPRLDVFLMLF